MFGPESFLPLRFLFVSMALLRAYLVKPLVCTCSLVPVHYLEDGTKVAVRCKSTNSELPGQTSKIVQRNVAGHFLLLGKTAAN